MFSSPTAPPSGTEQPRSRWSQGLLRSFGCAFVGIAELLRTQRNARLHALASLVVAGVACWLRVSRQDCCLLLLSMTLVWLAEGLNTAIEVLADRVTAERDEAVRRCKDIAAGAVLLAAGGAAVVGLLVLGLPLWERLE